MRGEESEIVEPDDVDAFTTLMPNAEVVSVPGAGHMVAGDQNTVFADAVLAYLGRGAPAQEQDRDQTGRA